jgi:XisH protein
MAKDLFHNTVKIALQKDDWKITHDPYQLRYGVADVGSISVLQEAFFKERTEVRTTNLF